MTIAASDGGIAGRSTLRAPLSALGADRRLVTLLIVGSVAIFLALLPIVNVQLDARPNFIPAALSSLLICCLLTSIILFGRYSVQQTPALLVAASAYLFIALTIAPGPEVMPGLFLTNTLSGAAGKGVSWLVLREAGFPLFVLAYALVMHDERPLAQPLAWALAAVGGVLVVVVGFACLANLMMPELMVDGKITPLMRVSMYSIWGLDAVAVVVLWLRRPHAALDLWLLAVAVTWTCQAGLGTVLVATRYDVGYYSGRIYGLVAAALVLVMLLRETRTHFGGLARTLLNERESAERQSRRVFETSQDIILITDTFGGIKQVSPSSAKVLGYQPEEMIGRLGKEFIFPEDLDATRQEVRAARIGDVMRNFRCRYVHKDGHPISLIWTGVWSEADRLHFFIGRDVTEVEAKEEQLRQSQKMEAVGQLTGGVAHDFNNILMVILANVEELLEADTLLPDQREQLNSIAASGQRAAELTRRLLAFSRKQRLMPQPTDMTDLVSGTDKLLRRTLGEQIEIEAILDDGLWTTDVDRAQLEAALVNLCVNARDAMPDGGRLLIETANKELDEVYAADNPGVVPGKYAMLAVSDTGTGMPPDVLKKVFEPFFTTKGVGKGTGLGLSMVYGFIKQSNGHIKIYSEVGRGTTIRMYMPRSSASVEESARPVPMLPRGHERILMVEDDDQVRTAVLAQLCSLGYVVSEAASAQQALDRLESGEKFDLMLTDVIMPGIDGPSLAKMVGERWPGLRIIFMSGYSENAARNHGRVAADACVLSKPFRKIDLALRVREVLGEA